MVSRSRTWLRIGSGETRCFGTSPSAISRRLGPSTITVTMDRYGHLLPSLEADPIARTAKTFTRALAQAGATGTDNVTPLK